MSHMSAEREPDMAALFVLDDIENDIREIVELTSGRMHGEPTLPDARRYERLLNNVQWLREREQDRAARRDGG